MEDLREDRGRQDLGQKKSQGKKGLVGGPLPWSDSLLGYRTVPLSSPPTELCSPAVHTKGGLLRG